MKREVVKKPGSVWEYEGQPPLIIKNKTIFFKPSQDQVRPKLYEYVRAKFKKAFQLQGALIVADSSTSDYWLQADFGPNSDAEIPKQDGPDLPKSIFTSRVEFNFYKQGQKTFPLASGAIYSTSSGDDLGWNAQAISDAIARSFGLKIHNEDKTPN